MSLPIVLASTSKYRKILLDKTGISFVCSAPDIDESPAKNEQPTQLVMRLAQQKAQAIAASHPESLIIGSDQVCTINNTIIGKPGSAEKAIEQLHMASGKIITFFTGLCLYDSSEHSHQVICETFNVHFRVLSDEQIRRYVAAEQPYDCAGSFKSEGLGIVLFNKLEGRDPNTLIGLPLIALTDMLANKGITLPL